MSSQIYGPGNEEFDYNLEGEKLVEELEEKCKSGEVRQCYFTSGASDDGWWWQTGYYVAKDGSGYSESGCAGYDDPHPVKKLTAEELKEALMESAVKERDELVKLQEAKLRKQNSLRQLEEELAKLMRFT